MRIAYISYEHPMGITGGGIGTYLGQIAGLMSNRGHEVEVFTCFPGKSETITYQGYIVNRIQAASKEEFRKEVVDAFRLRHTINSFDLIEAAEYNADAYLVKKRFSQVPLIIKLHTPNFLTARLNEYNSGSIDKLRFILGGVKRGKLVKPYWVYKKKDDIEYLQFLMAESICSPSHSLADIIKQEWARNKSIDIIPNLFVPNNDLLKIPVANYEQGNVIVSFFGRLEKRKGILELMKAIPIVLASNSKVIFRFIGKSHPSPDKQLSMDEYMRLYLDKWLGQIEFLGSQPYEIIPSLLAETHICVFPSLWENFPNVCLEAMSAGRAVIASRNGGMADMILDQEEGVLINPGSPENLADAILRLCREPSKISELGKAARKKVVNEYNSEKIGFMVEAFYRKAVAKMNMV